MVMFRACLYAFCSSSTPVTLIVGPFDNLGLLLPLFRGDIFGNIVSWMLALSAIGTWRAAIVLAFYWIDFSFIIFWRENNGELFFFYIALTAILNRYSSALVLLLYTLKSYVYYLSRPYRPPSCLVACFLYSYSSSSSPCPSPSVM